MAERNDIPGEWVRLQVDALLDRTGKRSGRVDAGYFHPSTLSDQCDTVVSFSFLGYPASGDIDARTARIFDMGNARDKAWKGYLEKSGLALSRAPLKMEIPDWRIRGECDARLFHPDTHEHWIGEIKTINQRGFDSLDGAPLPEHVIQTHCYMKGHDVPRAVVIYENKNDCAVKVYEVLWDDAVWNAITNRIIKIITALREGWLLDRDCKYGCRHKGMCALYNPEDAKAKMKEMGL